MAAHVKLWTVKLQNLNNTINTIMLVPMLMMAGIVLGIFLGVLLLILDRGNKNANRLLGTIMIISSICISDFAVSRLDLYIIFPHWIGIASSLLFLIGPLFFLYFKELMGENIIYKGTTLLHFLPFTLLIFYRLPFYLKSSKLKLYIFNNDIFFAAEHKVIIILQAIHVIIYLLVIKKIITKLSDPDSVNCSETKKTNLRWIKKCMGILSFIFYFLALFYMINFFGFDRHHIHSTIIPLVISFTILFVGFTGLKLPIFFPLQTDIISGRKYEKSTLSEDKADHYLQKLLSVMEEDRLYLQTDLTLQKLARHMSVLPNHLSQVINDKMNRNFFDFINSYRIKTAQELISDPRNDLLTMVAISYESGFNSKSSFNSAFKKFTGLTPSEYKTEIQKQKLHS